MVPAVDYPLVPAEGVLMVLAAVSPLAPVVDVPMDRAVDFHQDQVEGNPTGPVVDYLLALVVDVPMDRVAVYPLGLAEDAHTDLIAGAELIPMNNSQLMKPLHIIVIALLGITAWQQYAVPKATQQPIRQTPESEIGRYQLLELSNMRRDRFMVDTKTGRVWNIVCGDSQGKHNGDHSVAPGDCLSEGFEAITYYGNGVAPGPEQWEEAAHIRAEEISLMSLEELKKFEKEEEASRVRAEKMSLMTPEELKDFLQEEVKQGQQPH